MCIRDRHPGDLTYELVSEYVDGIVTVTDDEIAAAVLALSLIPICRRYALRLPARVQILCRHNPLRRNAAAYAWLRRIR